MLSTPLSLSVCVAEKYDKKPYKNKHDTLPKNIQNQLDNLYNIEVTNDEFLIVFDVFRDPRKWMKSMTESYQRVELDYRVRLKWHPLARTLRFKDHHIQIV